MGQARPHRRDETISPRATRYRRLQPNGRAGYSLSYRAVRHVLNHWQESQETVAEDRYIGDLVRSMPDVKRLNEPSILCSCGQDWKPCLLGHWIKTPEAMRAFHTKGSEYEQTTGISLSGYNPKDGFTTPLAEAPHVQTKPKSPATHLPTNGRIFVQIAAYRDRDLLSTLRDLVAKAKDPHRLRIGLCWQRAAEDSLEEFSTDSRMRVRDVPWQAKGICWARRCTQELYENEEFTLQIDAHERFVDGWDERLIRMLAETDAAKPILTTYPVHFTPGEGMPSGVPHQIQNAALPRERHREPVSSSD